MLSVYLFQGALSDVEEDVSVSADLRHLEFKLLHDLSHLQVCLLYPMDYDLTIILLDLFCHRKLLHNAGNLL